MYNVVKALEEISNELYDPWWVWNGNCKYCLKLFLNFVEADMCLCPKLMALNFRGYRLKS